MNNDEKTVNATSSLCWNCKFGMCVKEEEVERIYHAGMVDLNDNEDDDGDDPYDLFDSNTFEDDLETEESILEHTIAHERVKTICFWKPDDRDSPPIVVAMVKQCSRHNEK